ncbi:Zn-ribbon domain-containing OB-fold protein [Pseudonocardia lacus]|uniref:Zn-ribbon domain-containing OB-fold protein n=1 Tax=Pseudonocardia lacus TaxID=2835865 RepID=UPI001BDD5DD3|nr:OB-fold domain-containing protein [Pseudonocardia lacus]
MPHAIGADPRPRTRRSPDGRWRVAGLRCRACAEVAAYTWPVCPRCRGPVEPADFGPTGTVWSSTVVRIPVPGRTPPYALAYVDLDDGPRVLAHVVDAAEPATIGGRVRLTAPTADGDPRVEALA